MYKSLSTSSRPGTALYQRENLQCQCQNVSKILFRYFAVKGTESQELHRRLNPLDVHKGDVQHSAFDVAVAHPVQSAPFRCLSLVDQCWGGREDADPRASLWRVTWNFTLLEIRVVCRQSQSCSRRCCHRFLLSDYFVKI